MKYTHQFMHGKRHQDIRSHFCCFLFRFCAAFYSDNIFFCLWFTYFFSRSVFFLFINWCTTESKRIKSNRSESKLETWSRVDNMCDIFDCVLWSSSCPVFNFQFYVIFFEFFCLHLSSFCFIHIHELRIDDLFSWRESRAFPFLEPQVFWCSSKDQNANGLLKFTNKYISKIFRKFRDFYYILNFFNQIEIMYVFIL